MFLLLILVITIRKHMHDKHSSPRSATLQELIEPNHSRSLSRDVSEGDYPSSSVTPLLHTNFQNLQHNESTSTADTTHTRWNPADAFDDSVHGARFSPSLPNALTPTYVTKQPTHVSEHGHILPSMINTRANSLQSKPSTSTLPSPAASSISIYSQSFWDGSHNAMPASQLSTISIQYNPSNQRYEMLSQPSHSDHVASHDHSGSTPARSAPSQKRKQLGQLSMPPLQESVEPVSSSSLVNPYADLMSPTVLANPHPQE